MQMDQSTFRQWKLTVQDDDSVLITDEHGQKVVTIYPPGEQIRYFVALINALSGYDVEEVEILAKVRAARDARLLGSKPITESSSHV